MKLRTILIGALLIGEIIVFGAVYLFGKSGIKQLRQAQQDNQQLAQEVAALKAEVASLQRQQQEFESDPFYKEKIARERLQMSRPNEQIYLL